MLRKENSSHKLFNLDNDVQKLIEEGSHINGINQSQFIEFLVNAWDDNLNPIKNLKHIRAEKEILTKDIRDLEADENKIMDNLQKVEEWRKIKQQKKPEILENLIRVITGGRPSDAENIAKMQSITIGVPAIQLIFEAMAEIKKRNLQ